MPEFLYLHSPGEALQIFREQLHRKTEPEYVEITQALGRITASTIVAPHPLPSFPRSTVDGYAVRAADTFGASEGLPAYLIEIGEVPMGDMPSFGLSPDQCALIHTGGMLPEGADAVIMVEYTQVFDPDNIEILRSVAPGENVIKVGEDIMEGEEVIQIGTRLRPAEIGGLVALGITQLNVYRKPRVGILSSGDEVVPPHIDIRPGQVRDVNSYTLSTLVERSGGDPVRYGVLPDRVDVLREIASHALAECDMVVFTAGSSASTRDLTAQVIHELGEPGVLVHGVNVRPGKPTILAVCRGKAVVGLPGNPVSALVIAGLFVVPALESLMGLSTARPQPCVPASLTVNLSSQAGREEWVPVRLLSSPSGYQADPVFGKSNLIFTLTRADGLVRIPEDATGLSAGQVVEVELF